MTIGAGVKEVVLFSGGAMRTLLDDVLPGFECTMGAAVTVDFRLTSALTKAIAGGERFDLALMPRPELEALAGKGYLVADSLVDITRSAVGLAVREGALRPDIGSAEAVRHALLSARTIGYSDGPSGGYVTELLARLGIADQVAGRTRLTSRPVAELVASGGAEIGLQQIVAILPVPGAILVGPLPAELQNVIVYAAAIGSSATAAAAARALIAYLASPATAASMRRRGLEPVTVSSRPG